MSSAITVTAMEDRSRPDDADRLSTGGFVKCDDKRSVAWREQRRMSRSNSAIYADLQNEHQTRKLLSTSVWLLLDTERSGVTSDESVSLISTLTKIARKDNPASTDRSGAAASTQQDPDRKSVFADVLQQAKGDSDEVTLDTYLRTLEKQPITLECALADLRSAAHAGHAYWC